MLYLDLPKARLCILLLAYDKSDLEDISDQSLAEMRQLVRIIKRSLANEKEEKPRR